MYMFPVKNTKDYTHLKTQAVNMSDVSPFLDDLLTRQNEILSGNKRLPAKYRPEKRDSESARTVAHNTAKLNRGDPFAYGRTLAHAHQGLV